MLQWAVLLLSALNWYVLALILCWWVWGSPRWSQAPNMGRSASHTVPRDPIWACVGFTKENLICVQPEDGTLSEARLLGRQWQVPG